MDTNQWHGKTVWLTGASSGIGRSLALKLAKLGATVIISARRQQVLEQLAAQAPQHLLPFALDVTNFSQRQQYQNQLAERIEAIDVAIFVAGVVEYEDKLNFDIDRYQQVMNVNFFGLVNATAIAMPLLRQSRYKPYIVGVTSLTVLTGFPRAEIYGASKAAADYFLKSLRMDLPPAEFDITIMRPGFVETPMTAVNDFPMPFILSADAAAERMIKAMAKRKFIVNFPRRFSLLLSLLSCCRPLWYRVLGPRLSRHQ